MAISTLSSPLSSVANKIISVNSKSGTSLVRAQSEYKKFGDFLDYKRQELERTQLPDNKKIQKLANINVVNTFGSAGGLLGGLLGGALDLGGLVRGFFPGEGKKVGAAPQVGKPKTKPVIKSGKLRLGGIRALGVTNALFAGLDFATGLAEGESIGKSAAGTSGSLAGSLLGGAIGQALIPIPGVGFIIGSAAGGFLGGYGADRTYDAVESQRVIKAKQEAKLKEQSQAVERSKPGKVENQDNILNKFDDVANKFEGFVSGIVGGVAGLFGMGEHKIEGYSEELSDEDSPQKTSEGGLGGSISYGTGNAEFGDTGNVSNTAGWVHGHFQGANPQSVTNDTTKVVKALLLQGSPVYLNQPKGSIDLIPSKKYTDAELRNYVENARLSHTHSGTGSSIDVFVKKGTKVPVPLTDVRPTGTDYGGYGRGGNAGYIQGTRTWIGHLTKDSKAGLSVTKGEVKGTESPNISEGKNSHTSTETVNPNTPNNKSKIQSDVEGFRQFRNKKFGASKSRVATAGSQNFQIREMGIPGNKGYAINPLADDTNYEISEHEGAGHLENRAFDIPVPDIKSGDQVNQYWTSRGYKTLWRVKDHFNHVHVEIPKNKVQEFTKINSQSQVTTPPPKDRKVDTQMPYNQRTSALIVDRPSVIIASGGGGSSRRSAAPVSSGGGGGTTVINMASASADGEKILSNMLQYKLMLT